MYAIPTSEYNTICGCVKNDSGVSDNWLVISRLHLQIPKTLPNHDVIKTITINFDGISGKPDPNITL
jgi:hypothetical protein